jgi:hypothetical protein
VNLQLNLAPVNKSLQETYAPNSICYGCGPANPQGLHIRSFVGENGELVAEWQPQPHHQTFEGALNGGVIGTLLDCHCNWTAAYHLMTVQGLDRPACDRHGGIHDTHAAPDARGRACASARPPRRGAGQ